MSKKSRLLKMSTTRSWRSSGGGSSSRCTYAETYTSCASRVSLCMISGRSRLSSWMSRMFRIALYPPPATIGTVWAYWSSRVVRIRRKLIRGSSFWRAIGSDLHPVTFRRRSLRRLKILGVDWRRGNRAEMLKTLWHWNRSPVLLKITLKRVQKCQRSCYTRRLF